MKMPCRILPTVVVLFLVNGMGVCPGMAGSREKPWEEVKQAVEKGLPKTASEKLRQISGEARGEKAFPEAIRALGWALSLEAQIEGFQPVEGIRKLQAEIPQWPEEARPMMEVILARWYWNFFQMNRWRFSQRTRTDGVSGDDPMTWDLARILEEIDRHFSAALRAADRLRAVPVKDWDGLLKPGALPDEYRPTLYDFVAKEALEFYQAGEQAGNKAEGAFEIDASGAIFEAREQFLGWKLEDREATSPLGKAVRLYQDLLRFHSDAKQGRAAAEADLGRLRLGKNQAVGEEKSERYRKALARLVEENANDEISARARALWAEQLKEENALAEAHEVAKAGTQAFPGTAGGNHCFNVMREIEEPASSLSTERVWNEPWPDIRVSYRNLTQAHFRVVSYDASRLKRARGWDPDQLERTELEKLVQSKPVLEWSRDLPVTEDYQMREERVEMPRVLEPGLYGLLASHSPNFRKEEGNAVSHCLFWVSNLALVIRSEYGNAGEVGGFVLQAQSGEPVGGAEIEVIANNPRSGEPRWETISTTQTDEQGWFSVRVRDQRQVRFFATHRGQQISTFQGFGGNTWRQPARPENRTLFFTDRSIYRPGQTIRYKGLSVRQDREKGRYETRAGAELEVIFSDVNGQEIGRKKHRCNDYGSFSGSFQAPSGRLLGRMSLRVEGEGEASVQVEEYKRPKFKTTIDAPKSAARLGGEVEVRGSAMSYTGAPVDGAEVQFRVVRETRYPFWWRWWEPVGGESQEIARGRTRTAPDGTFSVRFTARPDRSAKEKDDPKFRFTVSADVTDSTGETRSGEQVVNLGYSALEATLSAGEWQEVGKAVRLEISTRSLDGEGREAKGKVQVYRLKEPAKVERGELEDFNHRRSGGVETWELGEQVSNLDFATGKDGKGDLKVELAAGLYRAVLETADGFGKAVAARHTIQVLDPAAGKLGLKIPFVVAAPSWRVEPGEKFTGLWGTGYDSGRAFVEVVHRGKHKARTWTESGKTQQLIQQAVDEGMRGGFQLLVTMVRENRAYTVQRKIEVPWSNKQLNVKWETHRSKLEPGSKEKWAAVITGPDAERVSAEMVAGMYDASLDAFLPHAWQREIGGFYEDNYNVSILFQNRNASLATFWGHWTRERKPVDLRDRQFPPELLGSWGGGRPRFKGGFRFAQAAEGALPETAAPMLAAMPPPAPGPIGGAFEVLTRNEAPGEAKTPAPAAPKPNLDATPPRRNLEETAFFFPQLTSGKDGVVRMEFTMPEALTTWKFQAFAHDRKLRSGFLEDEVVTAKDLMVQPNPPRFLREGDELEFTVKVLNQGKEPRKGTVRLTLQDARTLDPVDSALGNGQPEREFSIPDGQTQSCSWRLKVPDGQGVLIYKAVAAADSLSDGEEGYLPVLPRRVLVTESITLPIRGAGEKEFKLKKLTESAGSETLRHQSVTLQMVSNPAWYAVMALPYLMEFPHECSEQVFSRYYANSLAEHIALSDPKIRRVFDQWKGTKALDSPLEKNSELKSLILEETPWVRQAAKESEARRNVGVLFDGNRLGQERAQALQKLGQQQLQNGAWPWFSGGPPSEYITLHVVTGFGRLRHMDVAGVDVSQALRALEWLDAQMTERYQRIVRDKQEKENQLTPHEALYLYGRSFFLEDQPIPNEHRTAVDYFLGQAEKYWTKLGSRMSKAHVALALKRFKVHPEIPSDILKSLKEFSVSSEELGMYWKDGGPSYWWQHAPIETQAVMIEAFDEVAGDAVAVEDLKVWLLKQKQTQDWKTTKATADAAYALLRRGGNVLASDALVEVSLGGRAVKPESVEAGTGFFEKRFLGAEIEPRLGEVKLKKRDPGVAWGSLHWQYLESMEKITPHTDNPLRVTKTLFQKANASTGPVLRKVGPGDQLGVGDLLVTRLEIRVDRDMEFLHLEDRRGSGLEPANVLSGYRYQDSLGYYETTRDTATHFFLDRLPVGTYVIETETRVVHRGAYQTGMAEIQCMYAPEFQSHSESFLLLVK